MRNEDLLKKAENPTRVYSVISVLRRTQEQERILTEQANEKHLSLLRTYGSEDGILQALADYLNSKGTIPHGLIVSTPSEQWQFINDVTSRLEQRIKRREVDKYDGLPCAGLLTAIFTLAEEDQKIVYEYLRPGQLALDAEEEAYCTDFEPGGSETAFIVRTESWRDQVPDDIFVDSEEEWASYKDSMPWD